MFSKKPPTDQSDAIVQVWMIREAVRSGEEGNLSVLTARLLAEAQVGPNELGSFP